MEYYIDCGVSSGADAYKALALGARAVAVGRAMMPSLMKDGASGVEQSISKINDQLRQIMSYTGVADVTKFDKSVLWLNGKPMG